MPTTNAHDRFRLKIAVAAIAAVWLATGAARSELDTYTNYGVEDLLERTPAIVRESVQAPNGLRWYRIKGTGFDGFVRPSSVRYEFLANGNDALVVPLDSGGTGGVFAALVWTGPYTSWQYAGYLSSRNGHLDLWFEGGYITALTPVYRPSDPQSRPFAYRVTRYTVGAGKIVEVDSTPVPHGHDLPAWLYLDPGTRAFLGTDGEDAPVAIVCPNRNDYGTGNMARCTDRDEGTPIVVDGVASDGNPCTHQTSVHVHAADRSWSGYVRIDAMYPAVAPGTLLRWKGSTVRFERYVPTKKRDEAGTLVTVVTGPHAGTQRRIDLADAVLADVPVPLYLVCSNDARWLTLRR